MIAPETSRLVENSLEESLAVKRTLLSQVAIIEQAAELCIETLQSGNRIYFLGNGGSAADAQHLATELVGRFERDNSFAAQALTTDTSLLTAVGNDFGFDTVFSRQLKALARAGDLVVAISTSGNSNNILKAIEAARQVGARVLGLSGKDGGKMRELCDLCLVVASDRTCRIQECHITVGHILCELIENRMHTPSCA